VNTVEPEPTPGERLRTRVAGGPLVVPGVYDALSALIAKRAGFEALFVSGFSVSATQLGLRDHGLLTSTEMRDVVTSVGSASGLAVIADADTGYGGLLNVRRAVREFEHAGAAGILLEDKAWPPRPGQDPILPVEQHAETIRVACQARRRGLFVIARTDACPVEGVDKAIERCRAYAESGADALWLEAPSSEAELTRVADELAGHTLVVNIVERGVTPQLTRSELVELGFRVIVSPVTGLLAAAQAITDAFTELAGGTTAAVVDRMLPFAEMEALMAAHDAEREDGK
jgi:2-methylisocitrate lyase-like PEP mutase family enzyme